MDEEYPSIREIIPFMGYTTVGNTDRLVLTAIHRIDSDLRGNFCYDRIDEFLNKKPNFILFSFESLFAESIVHSRLRYDDGYREIFEADDTIPRIRYVFSFAHNVPSTYSESFGLSAIGFNTHEAMLLFKLTNNCSMKPISLEDFSKFATVIEQESLGQF